MQGRQVLFQLNDFLKVALKNKSMILRFTDKKFRDKHLVDAKGYDKILGVPITKAELLEAIKEYSKVPTAMVQA